MTAPRVELEIVPYDAAWVSRFEVESTRLAPVARSLHAETHHIGSTSVPGLDAKPIIDILFAVPEPGDRNVAKDALVGLGYQHNHYADTPERMLLFRGDPVSHQIHLVAIGNREYHRQLAFRNWLRDHPSDAAAYVTLKKALASQHGNDHRAYTTAKTDFVERIIRLAMT